MTLTEWRKSQGLTQIDAAERLGISQGFLSRIESSGTSSLKTALLIRNATDGVVKIETLCKAEGCAQSEENAA